MIIPILGASVKSVAQDSNYQKCINLMPISTGKDSRGGGALIPTPGLYEIGDLGGTSCRGIFRVDNYVYVARDSTLYRLEINLATLSITSTSLGTLQTSSGYVKFARNPTQLIIVDSSAFGYIVTLSSGAFAQIADTDFVGGSSVVFVDGYFIYNQPGTALLRSSALNNGTSWDAADVATAESKPDGLVGLAINRREIWAFGTSTVEVWYDAANASGLPFSPRIGSDIDIGCSAAGSIVETNNLIMWLDSRGFIVQSQVSNYLRENSSGYDIKIVSDDQLNAEIASYDEISDAIAFTYIDRGRIIYQISFPSQFKTWALDQTTGVWTERAYFSSYHNSNRDHLVQYCAVYNNKQIACGYQSGKIYIISSEYFDDDAAPIHRLRQTAPLSVEGKLVGIDKLELRMGSGKAKPSGLGSDPQISMRYSNDGGYTWSHFLPRSIGKIGEYGKHIIWNRLGSGTEWVFEFMVTEPIDFSIIEAFVSISEIEDNTAPQGG